MRPGPVVMLALAACSLSCSLSRAGSASGAGWSGRGPVWPKPAVREIDGGESLAPRAAARAIAAIAEDVRPADKPSADKPAAAAPTGPTGGAADKPAAAPSAVPAPDEAITTEEIVIEIED